MHPYSVLGQLFALLIIAPMGVFIGHGILGLICWRADRKHAAMVAQIEQAALVAIAYREVRGV
ncbi:hypothetical protein VDF70_12135 [Xanthomonas campestris pv. raphani]|uniref:hypothetical protein n=1 Tax=Xanthomonas campestris TaxID=339 RepID=UPI002B23A467|nr:hypothetical protein [Xanthomonas campestris]MEA9759802.1 hypothetical protein [Xanthomonas campestris pv. raphani]